MIRIVLLGRTGNHLFQYALGRVLSEKHRVPLVLDASWFNIRGWKEVSHFLRLPLKATIVRRVSPAARVLRRITGKHYWEYGRFPFLREKPDDQSFDPSFLESPGDCALFGYYQCPRYFESIASELRTELNHLIANAFPSGTWASAVTKARETCQETVAVHVRRGDYLNHPAFLVCDVHYYRNAMNRMRALIPGARFFIFSDDPTWCRSEFREPDTEIIDSGIHAANPLHDLHLMSLASHHIIANSTYSWWAAWLGKKAGQKVLMPDRWYARDIHAPIGEKRLPHWEIVSSQSI